MGCGPLRLERPRRGWRPTPLAGFDAGVLPRIRAAVAAGDEPSAVPLVTDAMVDACYVAGPADRCRDRIQAYRDAGVQSPLLLPRLADLAAVAEALAGA